MPEIVGRPDAAIDLRAREDEARRLQSATILSMVTASVGTSASVEERAGRVQASALGPRAAILPGPMPIYEYRRPDGSTFEVIQKFSDDPLTVDPEPGCRSSAS